MIQKVLRPIFILSFVGVFHVVCSLVCELTSYRTNNFRFNSDIFHTSYKEHVRECEKDCLKRTSCSGFNYNEFLYTCELLTDVAAVNDTRLVSHPGCIHGDISKSPTVTDRKCSTKPCPERHACADLTSETYFCYLSECESPPEVQNANISSTERGVKMSVEYICLDGYCIVGNPTITCKTDGKWSDPEFSCVGKVNTAGLQTGSSGFHGSAYPSFAIDGDKTTIFHSELAFNSFPQWWIVLNSVFGIRKIVVYKREHHVVRFSNVMVYVENNNGNSVVCDTFFGPTTDIMAEFICDTPIDGNVIRIEHRGPYINNPDPNVGHDYRILSLAEVEICASD